MKALPFYRDSFFNRLILSFTALAVLLLGLVGGYLYTQANQTMVGEIARDSQSRLVNVKDYVEGTVLTKYEDNLLNKAFSTIFIQNSSNLSYLLDHGWEGNLSRISSFRLDLDNYRQVLDGVSNMTVYFRNGGYVVDSDSFYMNPDHSDDVKFIDKLPNIVDNRWITRTLPNGKKVMTYVVRLPYQTFSPSPKGYLFVDVDLSYLNQVAADIYGTSNERFYIFDGSKNLVLQTAKASPEEIRLLQSDIASGDSVKVIDDHEQGSVVLSYLDGSKSGNGWTYAMIRPMNSFVLASKQLKTKIFVSCILVLLFGLIISYLISKRFYIPMNKLIQHIRNLSQPSLGSGYTNEYTIIGNTLNFMGREIADLKSQAQKNEMINLVLGASLGLEHLENLRRYSRYQVAHIRLIEGESETFKKRYEQLDHLTQYELVCLTPQEAAIIFISDSGTDIDEEANAAELASAKAALKDSLRFGAGIGSLVLSPEEIPISYQAALQAYRYRFMFGPEAIIPESGISAYDAKPPLFSLEVFQNALKAGNVEETNRFIDSFAAALKGKSLQLEAVELALLQLVSALYETVIELELQQIVSPSNLFEELKKDTLTDTISSIRGLSERIGVHVRDSGSHGRAEVIFRLKSYIDEHLQDELSLNVLSEVASLAPAYISTLFGEVMNESFTEYVTRTRLDKAAALLQGNNSLSVKEIAALVGYRNLQYFHTRFKSRFGVTPVQFRQTKQMASATE